MQKNNGQKLFGFWEGMPYRSRTDTYEDFVGLKNKLDKQKVIKHMESTRHGIAMVDSVDMFTGEKFRAGIYCDGDFVFSEDFLRYYKTRDEIGIPYEYEDYLMDILE